MWEWKRIFNWKIFLIIFLASMVNIGIFLYGQMSGRSLADTIFSGQENQHLVERYSNMDLNEAINRLTTENAAIRNDIRIQNNDQTANLDKYADDAGCQEMINYYRGLSDTQKNQINLEIKSLKSKLEYLIGYHNGISQIITNAANLKKFSIFSKPDSFSYNNIIKTANDFKSVQDLSLSLVNNKAIESFLNYYNMYYIAFGLMLVIIYGLFSERENGMWSMVHSSSNGRTRLTFKRLILLMLSSAGITALLYFTTLFTSLLLYGGWKDLIAPIQSIEKYYKFTYLMSIRHYIFNNFVISWFAIFTVCVVLWMLFVLFRNRNHALIFTGVFVGTEVLLFNKIEVQSVYNALKYINIINLFQMNEIYGTYNNWGFKTHVYSVLQITFTVLLLSLIIAGIIAILRASLMKPSSRQTLIAKFVSMINQQYQKVFTRLPITIKEVHKLIITGKGIWVVAAVLIIALYFTSSGKMSFTDSQVEYDKMYLEHGGKDYTYIQNYVDKQNQKYDDAKQKLNETAIRYENGEVDLKTYANAVSNVQMAATYMKSIEEFSEKINYLENIQQNYGIEGFLISDRGYEEIFGQYGNQRELILLLSLVIGIMIIISETISMEHRTGMEIIVRSCEKGRQWIFFRKIIACMLFTTILFILVYGIDFWNLYHIYGMPYLNAPVMSLTFMEGCKFHVSILTWIVIRLAARLLICIIITAIAILISKVIGKKGNRAVMPLILICMIGAIILLRGLGGIL